MNSKLHYANIFLVLLLLLVWGCSTIGGLRTASIPPQPPQKHVRPSMPDVISHFKQKTAINIFRAQGNIKLRASRWKGSGKVFVVGKYPTDLHMEIIDFWGNPKWVINATPKGVQALNVNAREIYLSSNTKELLTRLFAIPADLDEVFYLFTGQKPPVNWNRAAISWLKDRKAWLLEVPRQESDDDWRLFLSPDGLKITKTIIWHQDDRNMLRIVFDEYSNEKGFLIPFQTRLFVKDAEMEIDYKKFITDDNLDPDVFVLKVPKGVKRIRL